MIDSRRPGEEEAACRGERIGEPHPGAINKLACTDKRRQTVPRGKGQNVSGE